ncbi:GAF and ANTAR domain-containing protein [Rhodococcoides fascians]|uniref:GAF and ANTAR domain-containing protein n=1 Tax=Rhodococcoides fascians TaxID=1828 RepID=UPI0009B8B353|nr:GAF and ANTAR domain-containing protein [Rhodococcus fascians]
MGNDHAASGRDLTRAIADATRSFFAPASLVDTLRGVTESARSLIPAVDCADILVVRGPKKYQSHAATSELPVRLDAIQEKLGEGPCVDAARTEVFVRCNDFRSDPRWPAFGPAAVEAGVHSSMSFRLYADGDTIGALNLFALTADAFGDDDQQRGGVLATHAVVALYAANKTEQFTSALASRDTIGQAKGMLMERFGIDAVQAFDLLARLSQNDNIPVATLAADLVRRAPSRRPRADVARRFRTSRHVEANTQLGRDLCVRKSLKHPASPLHG